MIVADVEELSDSELQTVIERLVAMTIDRDKWEDLQTAIREIKDAAGPDQAKAALLGLPEPIDPDAVLKVANEYCDRLFAGIDQWPPVDQERWVNVCQMVTELTSSVQ
jgi:hypothetical protein